MARTVCVILALIGLVSSAGRAQSVSLSPASVPKGESTVLQWSGFPGNVNLELWKGDLYTGINPNSNVPGVGSQELNTRGALFEIRADYRIKVVLRSNTSVFRFSNYFEVRNPPERRFIKEAGAEHPDVYFFFRGRKWFITQERYFFRFATGHPCADTGTFPPLVEFEPGSLSRLFSAGPKIFEKFICVRGISVGVNEHEASTVFELGEHDAETNPYNWEWHAFINYDTFLAHRSSFHSENTTQADQNILWVNNDKLDCVINRTFNGEGPGIITPPPPVRTLTVQSAPRSGVTIEVSPEDRSRQTRGVTTFSLSYDDWTLVRLEAPPTFGGDEFSTWMVNGAPQGGPVLLIRMDADYTAVAVYQTPMRTLTVQSSPSAGAAIAVSPADRNGEADGQTPFSRTYDRGTLVTLSVREEMFAGELFDAWLVSGVRQVVGPTIEVRMESDTVAVVQYRRDSGPACQSGGDVVFCDDFNRATLGPDWGACGDFRLVEGRLRLASGNCPFCGEADGVSGVSRERRSWSQLSDVALELFIDNRGPSAEPGAGNNINYLVLGEFRVAINQDPRGLDRLNVRLVHRGEDDLADLRRIEIRPGRYEFSVRESTNTTRFRNIEGGTNIDLVGRFTGPAVTEPLCIMVNQEDEALFDDLVVRDLSPPPPPPVINQPPECRITVVSGAERSTKPGVDYEVELNQTVIFSGTESVDPNKAAGDSIAKYEWFFYPSAVQEDQSSCDVSPANAFLAKGSTVPYAWARETSCPGIYCIQLRATDHGNPAWTPPGPLSSVCTVTIEVLPPSFLREDIRVLDPEADPHRQRKTIKGLHIFDHSEGQQIWKPLKSSLCHFNPSYPTLIMVHGWNPTTEGSFPGCNVAVLLRIFRSFNPHPNWVESPWLEMARLISGKWTREVNLLYWDWQGMALDDCPPGFAVQNQALLLAGQLRQLFDLSGYNQDQPLQLLGHSLGAHIVAWAAADSRLRSRVRENRFVSRVDQVTCFDPPETWLLDERTREGFRLSNICNPIKTLRETSPDTYIEMITGPTSFYAHHANLLINPPGIGHNTYTWYNKTIEQGLTGAKPCLFSGEVNPSKLDGTIGFAISPVLRDSGVQVKRPDPDKFGNAAFSTGKWCLLIILDDVVFYPCTKDVPPQCLGNPDFVFSERRSESTRCGCKGGDQTCEIIQSPQTVLVTPSSSWIMLINELRGWSSLNFDYQFANSNSTPAFLTVSAVNRLPGGDGGAGGQAEERLALFTMSAAGAGTEVQNAPTIPVTGALLDFTEFEFRVTALDTAAGEAEVSVENFTLTRDESFGNLPPTANAGPDQTASADPAGSAEVFLSGSQSQDPEGGPLAFLWLLGERQIGNTQNISISLPVGTYQITLIVADRFDARSTPDEVVVEVIRSFIRGDCNCDGSFNISDPVATLKYLFNAGSLTRPLCCLDACDVNDDNGLNITDAIFSLDRLFVGGRPPPAPFPTCGVDPSDDDLGCATYQPCGVGG